MTETVNLIPLSLHSRGEIEVLSKKAKLLANLAVDMKEAGYKEDLVDTVITQMSSAVDLADRVYESFVGAEVNIDRHFRAVRYETVSCKILSYEGITTPLYSCDATVKFKISFSYRLIGSASKEIQRGLIKVNIDKIRIDEKIRKQLLEKVSVF